MGLGAVWVCGRQRAGTVTLLFVVYLFSHKQRASVSIWLLPLALSYMKKKERERVMKEKDI